MVGSSQSTDHERHIWAGPNNAIPCILLLALPVFSTSADKAPICMPGPSTSAEDLAWSYARGAARIHGVHVHGPTMEACV